METEEIANNNKRIKLLVTCFIVFIEFTICIIEILIMFRYNIQSKSSASPVDVRILRELQGVMQKVGATQGLLVAWEDLQRMQFKNQKICSFQSDCGIKVT